jgi:hypothetical protein
MEAIRSLETSVTTQPKAQRVIPEGLFEKECCGVYWNILRRSKRNWRNIRNEELHGLFSTPDDQVRHALEDVWVQSFR